ncbi:MAG: glycosyltransferase family 4 protein [Desulfotomaculaceae bacterium]|nr:glycosyltransferase family 4 protein [Desulfotomaculaceae bacterium]
MKRLGYLCGAPRVSTRPDAEAGGPRTQALGVIGGFKALGWEVKPFVLGDRLPPVIAGKGTDKLMTANPVITLMTDLTRIGLGVINARRCRRELGGQVDWVYERFATLQSLGWIFQRKGVPWILETSGPFYHEAKEERKSLLLTGLARRLEVEAYRQCDVLVCVSQALKEFVIRECGIDAKKIIVAPCGVDTAFFDASLYPPHRIFENFTVGYVGFLIAWQGLDILFQAVSELKKEGLSINVVVVGDGPARREWECLANDLDLTECVRFTGRISLDEVPAYIAGFDLGYSGHLPLKIGSMYHSPLKLYEYMAMGKPVLASAHDDACRLVEGKRTGFLYHPGDVQDLKRALREAYQARPNLVEIGEMARQEIVKNHSWVARIREMVSQTEEILGVGTSHEA